MARALRNKGRYEKDWTAWMRAHVEPGMQVVDVGANVGYYTVLLASLVRPTGRVIACEPDPGNAALLRRSVAENRFSHVATPRCTRTRPGTASIHWRARTP